MGPRLLRLPCGRTPKRGPRSKVAAEWRQERGVQRRLTHCSEAGSPAPAVKREAGSTAPYGEDAGGPAPRPGTAAAGSSAPSAADVGERQRDIVKEDKGFDSDTDIEVHELLRRRREVKRLKKEEKQQIRDHIGKALDEIDPVTKVENHGSD